jgi:hypothetical protein
MKFQVHSYQFGRHAALCPGTSFDRKFVSLSKHGGYHKLELKIYTKISPADPEWAWITGTWSIFLSRFVTAIEILEIAPR